MPDRLSLRTSSGDREINLTANERKLPISELLASHGVMLNTRCGGKGTCHGCMVDLEQGGLIPLAGGPPLQAPQQNVLACRYRPADGGSVVLSIPDRTRVFRKGHVVSDFTLRVVHGRDPLITGRPQGLAIDIGTTTVVVALVDLETGTILGRASSFNGQIRLADDVISRIQLCMGDPQRLHALQNAITVETLDPLIREVLAGRPCEQVGAVAIAGNTTMLHLLAGVDPSSMGVSPFTPTFLEHRVMEAGKLRLPLPSQTPVLLLPGASAYVGADITAGMVATGMRKRSGASLLVDVGTNGEIVLHHAGHFLGCATAAGPAFEGSRLTSGTRAQNGAISHIQLGGRPLRASTTVLGPASQNAFGLCGTAYVDFLAEGRRTGLLGPTGRFDERLTLPTDAEGGRCFPIAGKVLISERDVASLLTAKAAVAAGILTLLERQNLHPSDIGTVFLAGGFGLHMDVANAVACGLLPGFTPKQIDLVGNTSLAGAFLALVDRSFLAAMIEAARTLEAVELNLDPGFESRYIEQMSLP